MSGRSRLAAVLRHMSSAVARQSAQPTSLLTFRNVAASAIVMLERHASQATWSRQWAMQQSIRQFATDELPSSVSDMPENEYHRLADQTMDDLADRLEAFVENIALYDGDVEYSQGVLTLKLGDLGTYVINKQAPNRQIWMSSPVSGPIRYDYLEGKWVYHRDGHHMLERLQKELSELTGGDPDLSPCYGCGKLNSCFGELCR